MRNGCPGEGTLQSYIDGELSSDRAEATANHLASCVKCATAAQEAEAESAMFREALAPEFSMSVPTERLRFRLDSVINSLQTPERKGIYSLRVARDVLNSLLGGFIFTPRRAAAAAGLAAVVIGVGILGLFRMDRAPTVISAIPIERPVVIIPIPVEPIVKTPSVSTVVETLPPVASAGPGVRGHKAASLDERRFVAAKPKERAPVPNQPEKLLPGEKSYLRAIAKLKGTIEDPGEPAMKPTLRFEYERNLAVVDRAIATSRLAAQQNPKDPDASEFLLFAYQSKVDLLNTVAEQGRFSPSGR